MAYLTWILGVLIADQISKVIVLTYIPPYQSVPLLKGFLRFTHIRNPGGAFGILRSYGLWIALITIAVSGVLLSLLLFGSIKSSTVKIGLAIIIGGALGNLIDRLRWGYVIDFIDFRMFPVFNLADMAIVVGTGLIFLILLKSTGAR